MYTRQAFLYVLATFVLMYEDEKIVLAKSLDRIPREVNKYTTRYDNIDVDGILASQRLLRNYVHCLLEIGACTTEGKELKKYIPDALATECSKCSAVQKKQAGKIFSHLLLNNRDYWDKLTAKYDPDGNFQKKYEQTAEDEDYSNLEDAK